MAREKARARARATLAWSSCRGPLSYGVCGGLGPMPWWLAILNLTGAREREQERAGARARARSQAGARAKARAR